MWLLENAKLAWHGLGRRHDPGRGTQQQTARGGVDKQGWLVFWPVDKLTGLLSFTNLVDGAIMHLAAGFRRRRWSWRSCGGNELLTWFFDSESHSDLILVLSVVMCSCMLHCFVVVAS